MEMSEEEKEEFTDLLIDREECVEELSKEEILEKENKELRKKVKELEIDLTTVYIKGIEDGKEKYKQKIKDKIKEYLDYDKKHKTYTKDGRENFTMEYFKAKALQKLLQESENK